MVGAARRAVFLSNLGNFLLGVFIAAIAALFIYILVYPYFNAWFSGGTEWTLSEFTKLDPPDDDIYFLSVEGDLVADSGYYEESSYLFIPIGQDHFGVVFLGDDTAVITKSGDPLPDLERGYRVTGTLKDFDSIGNEARQGIMGDIASLNVDIYPKLLDMTDAENKGFWIAGALVCIGALLFGLYRILRSIGRTLNSSSHPVWKNLSRFNQPSEDVLRGIEADRDSGSQKYGDLTLSRNWLVQHSRGNLQAARLQDIVWVHGFIQSGRYGSTYFVKAYDRHGIEMQGKVKKDEMEPTLNTIHQRVPWALAGTNKEAEKTWKKNRAEFIRQVDERKKAMQNPPTVS